MEMVDQNQEAISSRFSLISYFSEDNDSGADQNFEIRLMPERSLTDLNRLSPTTSPLKATQELSENDVKYGKRYPRRISVTETLYNSPSTTAISGIPEFVETAIVLRKGKNNELGISIAGGSDTYLESVVVTEIHSFGAAYKDGRLRKGDLILAVNDISFREISKKDAVRVLKESPSPLKLIVLRENPQILFTTSQTATKFLTVELRKTSIQDKLGLSFMQRTNGRGVFVTYVPGSTAARQGRKIMQGDQICEVNGQNVRECNQKDVANIINSLDGEIVLLLGRNQALTNYIQEWSRKKAQMHWRNRTSTWSAYGGTKDKVQNQRPSLPAAKEQPYFAAKYSPDRESAPVSALMSCIPPTAAQANQPSAPVTSVESDDPMYPCSRSSSIRSRTRLSVVVENNKTHSSSLDLEEPVGQTESADSRNLPSIEVTEF